MDPKTFLKQGYFLKRNFLTAEECSSFLKDIQHYRSQHRVPEIYRKVRGRSLRYKVIDGLAIREKMPLITAVYRKVNELGSVLNGAPLFPLSNERVGLNINITPPQGEYRWHYDRNRLTAILYLNEVGGGQTEIYPNFRIHTPKLGLQKWLDKVLLQAPVRTLFGRQVLVKPERGALLLMLGNSCLHSVRPVLGHKERINVIMSYDEQGREFAFQQQLDAYLYEDKKHGFDSDPNYDVRKNKP